MFLLKWQPDFKKQYIPINKLMPDSAEDSGWYSLPIFSLFVERELPLPPFGIFSNTSSSLHFLSTCLSFLLLQIHEGLGKNECVKTDFYSSITALLLHSLSADSSVFVSTEVGKESSQSQLRSSARQDRKPHKGDKKKKKRSQLGAVSV